MKLSNPLFTLDHERLKKDLAFIRGEKFSRFIRRRTVFYMDGYRYAYAAAKKRWNIDFAFFEAGHEIVKPVYLSGSLNEKAAEIWWRKMHENPQFTRQLIRELEILIKSTKRLARSIPRRELAPKEIERAIRAYLSWWVAFFELAYLWFAVENIKDKLEAEIQGAWRGSRKGLQQFLDGVYRPTQWPRSSLEQRDLLKIAGLKGESQVRALTNHTQKYRHLALHDTLADTPFDLGYFETRLKVLLNTNEYRRTKKILESADAEIRRANQLLRRSELPSSIKRRIHFVRSYMFLRTESIDYVTTVYEAYQRVFVSFARLFGLSIYEALHMTYQEILLSLRRGKLAKPKSEIRGRADHGYAYLIAPHASFLVTGADVDRLQALIIPRGEGIHKLQRVKGQTAYSGKVKGIVRVILDSHRANELKEGEILVTAMTNPEYVPAMKRSVGIITNEGGILCHAAIMSREFQKPCIIGTRNATDVFATGDVIFLDADDGIAKILHKKSL